MNQSAELELKRLPDKALVVTVSGRWKLGRELPQADQLLAEIEREPKAELIFFDASALAGWDSGLLVFLIRVMDYCSGKGIAVDRNGLPAGVRRLLELASAVPEKKGSENKAALPFLARIGDRATAFWISALAVLRLPSHSAGS